MASRSPSSQSTTHGKDHAAMTSSTTPDTAASNGGTTTETAIEIPGYVTMITPAQKRDICGLASYAAELLLENSDLPAPVYFSISQAGQEVSLQFGDTRDSFRALAQWLSASA